jgi:P27 family predicted phage terminase small subunit
MPPYLTPAAAAEWARLLPLLLKRRVLTVADGAVLAEHCQAAADVERFVCELAAKGEVVVTPNGALQRHPYTVLLREARERLLKTAALLGMTPADRSRAAQAEDPQRKLFESEAERHFFGPV